MVDKFAASDGKIAEVAARQHGVVDSPQLQDAGLSREMISERAAAGRFHRVFRGVYAVGHPAVSREGLWMAAVLACDGGNAGEVGRAFLSHHSAAELWGLLAPRGGPVDVAIIGETGRARRAGIRVHRPRTLEIDMTTRRHGIPVTAPARTISDLRRAKPSRGGAADWELRRSLRQAAVLGLDLGPGAETERTRSDLEVLFQRICRTSGLPTPEVNVKVGPFEVDFLWRDARLIAETDGYRYHRGEVAFQDDHARDLYFAELDFRLLRFAEVQLEREPTRIADLVRRELAATSSAHG